MKIISETDLRVTTDWGGVVMFYAGVEKEVSDEIGLLAMQLGAKASQGASNPIDDEMVVEETVELDIRPTKLLDRVVAICNELIDEGDPNDFTLDGSPKAKAINEKAGEKVAPEIREMAWALALNG